MFTITRRQIHQFRVIARKALSFQRGVRPPIVVQPTDDGLLLRIQSDEAAVELRLPDERQGDRMCIPFEFLDECQGKNDTPVVLTVEDGKAVARWQDGSVPRESRYDQPGASVQFPAMPAELTENSPGLLQALADTCDITTPEATRYALTCVQLDGDRGSVAASDGHQILVQKGFDFPWEGTVLLPAHKLFSCPQLPVDERIGIGRNEDWLTMRVGPWTFHFALNVEGRFPRVEECIPRESSARTTLEIADGDAAFLSDNIRHLPTPDDHNRPITLDLNGEVVIRARGEDSPAVTELALVNSTRSGDQIRLATNRAFLARAVTLGFRQVHFVAPDQPAFCRDSDRAYVWALIGPDGAIAPTGNPQRIESPRCAPRQAAHTAKPTRSRIPPMSATNTNGNGRTSTATAVAHEADDSSPIEQAEALRDSLKDTLDKTRDLIRTLKRQKKQSRIVESTLASLRQLQTTGL